MDRINSFSLANNFIFLFESSFSLAFFLSLCNYFCCMGVTEVLNKGENFPSSPRVGCHDQLIKPFPNICSHLYEMRSTDFPPLLGIPLNFLCVTSVASRFWILVACS